jgi:YVTN family beta-propeller protein
LANNTVSIIDTGSNRVIGSVPVPFQPAYLAVAPDARHVYVVTGNNNINYPGSGILAVIATATKKVIATVTTLPYNPVGIVVSPDGSRVYVASGTDYTDAVVSVIDTATNTVVATIPIPDSSLLAQGITISSDGKKLYVPIEQGHAVSGPVAVVDTTTYQVTDFVVNAIYQFYLSAAISPDNSKLYTNAYIYPPGGAYVIAIFNPATGALIKTMPDVMTVSIFSPDAQHLYGIGLGGVGVIDTATDVAITAVANLPGATNLAITPDGRHLYITDTSTNSVAVADTSTYTISTVIGGLNGVGPIGIVPAP